ncbi:hypothetical protein [Amycolatopsis anabasis]|uniref:hypothetical protein n=1 Tax=Amycolatopsis anabasis TaxID=1840409 RepID=UPI00131DFC3C|nr:hypothetical protein [Amycolatopsis anabasis]
MAEVPSATQREAVINLLDYLDVLLERADEPSKAALAESEIARLTMGLAPAARPAHSRSPRPVLPMLPAVAAVHVHRLDGGPPVLDRR